MGGEAPASEPTPGVVAEGGDLAQRRALAVVAFGVFVAADDLMVVATMLRPIINELGLILPDDLDATEAAVRAAGGRITEAPDAGAGDRQFHFADPSGNEMAVWSAG